MNSIGCIIAWLAGCLLGLVVVGRYPTGLDAVPAAVMFFLAALLLPALLLGWENKNVRWASLFAVFALLGCGRALLIHPPVTSDDLAYYNGVEGAQITGVVSGEPVYQDRTQRLRVSAEMLRLEDGSAGRQVRGDVMVMLPRFPEFSMGERVTLSGTLTAPPKFTAFDYAAYLARQGVYSYMGYPKARSFGYAGGSGFAELVANAREAVRDALQRSVPDPEASLAVGVVIGDRSSMPSDLQEDFRVSGTVHVLAISGQNIALLVGFVWLLYSKRTGGRRMPIWLALLVLGMLVLYTLFTGSTPSVVRAAAMGAVLLMAPIIGRRYDPVAAVAVAAFIMALFDPDVLLDGGFQLSFAAMLGITLLSPFFMGAMLWARIPRFIAAAFAASFAAQSATIPLIILFTGRLSLVSPLASLSIEPALLPLMVAGIVTGILGAIWPPLAVPFAPFVWLSAAWMIWAVGWWASLPMASVNFGEAQPLWAIAYYAALAYLLWLLALMRRQRLYGE